VRKQGEKGVEKKERFKCFFPLSCLTITFALPFCPYCKNVLVVPCSSCSEQEADAASLLLTHSRKFCANENSHGDVHCMLENQPQRD